VAAKGKSRLLMTIPTGCSFEYRKSLMERWAREQLAGEAQPILDGWIARLGLDQPVTLHIRRMRTRWATVNECTGRLTLNTEAARQPLELIELLIVHELGHFRSRGHGQIWLSHMDTWLPGWRERQARLDAALLSDEAWGC